MCQAIKDGGLRCAAHLKEGIDKLQSKEKSYFEAKEKEFVKNNPEVVKHFAVAQDAKKRVEKLENSLGYVDRTLGNIEKKIATFEDVEKSHGLAMEAKNIRDSNKLRNEQKETPYDNNSSFESFSKVFGGINEKISHDEDNQTALQLLSSCTEQSDFVQNNPEAVLKAHYFEKSARKEFIQREHAFKTNPSDENKERKDEAEKIYEKSKSVTASYGFDVGTFEYDQARKKLEEHDPKISAYQYNYEYEVENFRNRKKDFEKTTAVLEESRSASEAYAGSVAKASENFSKNVYPKDSNAVTIKSELASMKAEYELTRSYRSGLAENIRRLKNSGKDAEARIAQIKLDVLTNAHNDRRVRQEAVNAHMETTRKLMSRWNKIKARSQ